MRPTRSSAKLTAAWYAWTASSHRPLSTRSRTVVLVDDVVPGVGTEIGQIVRRIVGDHDSFQRVHVEELLGDPPRLVGEVVAEPEEERPAGHLAQPLAHPLGRLAVGFLVGRDPARPEVDHRVGEAFPFPDRPPVVGRDPVGVEGRGVGAGELALEAGDVPLRRAVLVPSWSDWPPAVVYLPGPDRLVPGRPEVVDERRRSLAQLVVGPVARGAVVVHPVLVGVGAEGDRGARRGRTSARRSTRGRTTGSRRRARRGSGSGCRGAGSGSPASRCSRRSR